MPLVLIENLIKANAQLKTEERYRKIAEEAQVSLAAAKIRSGGSV